ncbi:radical SAM/Cys-rich domain protein [Halochromatium sp.]
MLDSKPLLFPSDFPSIRRRRPRTLQVNLGYRCNQSCLHCHVDAGPKRVEEMSAETLDAVLAYLRRGDVELLDITGGAPELNQVFRPLVIAARGLGMRVMDRCNLTILGEPGQEDLADFLAEQEVEVIASLPCYLEENVDGQRGTGTFEASIRGLRELNARGYGRSGRSSPDQGLSTDGQSGVGKADLGQPGLGHPGLGQPGRGQPARGQPGGGRSLSLVYNPIGANLPPAQSALEADYKRELEARYGVYFDHLLTLANMPIRRFGSWLQSTRQFAGYLALLKDAHQESNLDAVMCRDLISIDWQGYVFDCDFNQMLDLPLERASGERLHIRDLSTPEMLSGRAIQVGEHCYGCTAGQGSSCGGALA